MRKYNTDDGGKLPYSDAYNARAFVQAHGTDLHYCWPWRKWLVYTGTHWQHDTSGEVMERARQTVKGLRESHKPITKALSRHIQNSLSNAKLKAMVEQAQSMPGIPVQPIQLDSDPWLLNCLNGTLDLRVDILRPHQRDDLLTRCLAVAYDPLAQCPVWLKFLNDIMGGNENLINFLQRAIGSSLTGVIREHALFILYGTGRDGKSTFLNTIMAMLGAYAMKAPTELLMANKYDRHPTEKADLHGKRLVAAIEAEQGRKLSEVLVKE